MAAKLSKCRDLVNTGQVSKKITVLRRELFTAALEERIQKEIENLDLTHLPFRVADRSEDGQSMFGVFLNSPVGVANDKVLSEGEQRALALACFLGELGGDNVKNGIVIDDPVLIARPRANPASGASNYRRGGEGSAGRCIHAHLLFFNEVADAAAQATPQVPGAKPIITKSAEHGFGLISEED